MTTRTAAMLLCALAFAAQGADKPCTPADSKAAAKNVDLVMTWPQLQKAVKDYGQCDAGDVGDIFTDALMRLAVEWKHVDLFAAAMRDPAFKAFVAAHMKAPSASQDADAVYSRAKLSCPSGQDAFCAELAATIKGEPAKPPAPEPPKEPPKDAK